MQVIHTDDYTYLTHNIALLQHIEMCTDVRSSHEVFQQGTLIAAISA